MYAQSAGYPSINGRFHAAQTYAAADATTGVDAATPHKLILMLFDGAMLAVGNASACVRQGRLEDKHRAVSKALNILEEGLRASLDRQNGGEIALRLDGLYDYMARRLLLANLRNDTDIFAEVGGLLRDLRDTWSQIGPEATVAGGTRA
jgi:flagellar secretion chaperone FliS